MSDNASIITGATFVSAFVGATLGVMLDRVWRRIESRPLFRVEVGSYQDREGRGRTLTITNVGLDPVPEYKVFLFHAQRGSLGVYNGDPLEHVFPQYPDQENRFRCPTQPDQRTEHDLPLGLHDWFHHVKNKPISAPSFEGFTLRLVMRNSEMILFEDEGLGNYVAKELYEDVTGKEVEQKVKQVFYRSKAPVWVEMIRKYQTRKFLRQVEKEV